MAFTSLTIEPLLVTYFWRDILTILARCHGVIYVVRIMGCCVALKSCEYCMKLDCLTA
jgi:hypothetical protein